MCKVSPFFFLMSLEMTCSEYHLTYCHTFSGSIDALTDTGREGLFSIFKRRLWDIRNQQAATHTLYQQILGLQMVSLESSDEEENLDSDSSTDDEL